MLRAPVPAGGGRAACGGAAQGEALRGRGGGAEPDRAGAGEVSAVEVGRGTTATGAFGRVDGRDYRGAVAGRRLLDLCRVVGQGGIAAAVQLTVKRPLKANKAAGFSQT